MQDDCETRLAEMDLKVKDLKLQTEKENSSAKTELEDLKRYTAHIEIRFKEMSDAEDIANRKVLTLLDEVKELTKENQFLLKQKESLNGIWRVPTVTTQKDYQSNQST